MQMKKSNSRGFTLLEILLVVAIIAILAGIVIIAINPARQLALTRNAQRLSALREIDSAMQQYYIDNGAYPASSTPTTLTEICNTGATSSPSGIACGTLIDLSILVPTYIPAIPVDPGGPAIAFIPTAQAVTNGTGFKITVDTTGRSVILTATNAELGTKIGVRFNGVEWSSEQSTQQWQGASDTCTNLGTGWRLPTITELMAGISNQFVSSGVNPGGFTSGTSYWSGTNNGSMAETSGWISNIVQDTNQNKTSFSHPFRCVK
jgi:type IV pilus assembly protein PilA